MFIFFFFSGATYVRRFIRSNKTQPLQANESQETGGTDRRANNGHSSLTTVNCPNSCLSAVKQKTTLVVKPSRQTAAQEHFVN